MDDVFAFLTLALDRGAPTPYDWLMFNPSIAPIQNDVRFRRFADASRGQHEKLVGLLNDARRRGILPGYLEAPLAQATARLTQGAAGRGR